MPHKSLSCRKDFPFFSYNPAVSYLDSAATTHKPQIVIDAIKEASSRLYSPVQRSLYASAEAATMLYENARASVAQFIGANAQEVAFTKGATESINLVACALEDYFNTGDEIILSELEHHANLIPWQQLAFRKKLIIKFIPVTITGELNLSIIPELLSAKTKLIAVTALSNVTGASTDLAQLVSYARLSKALVLIDGAQLVAHKKIDVHALGIDFLVFSGHKIYGPTGIGVLYSRHGIQHILSPYQTGGSMVFDVSYEQASWREYPYLFEAGTPHLEGAVGIAAAIDYLHKLDFTQLQAHEASLCAAFIEGVKKNPSITLLANPDQLALKSHLVSFIVKGWHPHDVAAYLDQHSICVRAGHQCAQPLHKKWGVTGSVRISFGCYSTLTEVERLLEAFSNI